MNWEENNKRILSEADHSFLQIFAFFEISIGIIAILLLVWIAYATIAPSTDPGAFGWSLMLPLVLPAILLLFAGLGVTEFKSASIRINRFLMWIIILAGDGFFLGAIFTYFRYHFTDSVCTAVGSLFFTWLFTRSFSKFLRIAERMITK